MAKVPARNLGPPRERRRKSCWSRLARAIVDPAVKGAPPSCRGARWATPSGVLQEAASPYQETSPLRFAGGGFLVFGTPKRCGSAGEAGSHVASKRCPTRFDVGATSDGRVSRGVCRLACAPLVWLRLGAHQSLEMAAIAPRPSPRVAVTLLPGRTAPACCAPAMTGGGATVGKGGGPASMAPHFIRIAWSELAYF